jgi:4'-phosphopantetheinyl transferase
MHNSLNNIVDIWTIQKNTLASLRQNYHSTLSAEEMLRANKFHFEKDKDAFIIYHASQRMILAHYLKIPPKDITITIREKGKPFLQNSSLRFNLSHSHEIAMLAITCDTDIGVDIEYSKKMSNFLDIAKKFFHPEEYRQLIDIQRPVEQRDYFYLLWTVKEALLKATGEGISAGLNNFHVKLNTAKENSLSHTHASNISLMRLNCPENYLASLAIIGKQKTVQYHHFSLF